MEAYLDNCVVSGMVRGDLPTAEMAVIPVLKTAVDTGRLRLVTSRESYREQNRAIDPNVRALLVRARPDFPLVAENEKLLGFNIQDNPGTFIASPMLTEYVDADLYEKLKEVGLDDADARHLMYAVHNKCERFVTTDPHFLSRRSGLAALCGATEIVTPSELAAELRSVAEEGL
jgi:predicted nucleic acid-binding protein